MKRTKNKSAITLIAVIITIIILLILTVLTIGFVKKNSIIRYAQNASNIYNKAKVDEEDDTSKYETLIEENTQTETAILWTDNSDGTFTSNNGAIVEIGDYVEYLYKDTEDYYLDRIYSGCTSNQTISQTQGLRWRVLGINAKGELELISEQPTMAKLKLENATAYNNGVYILNNICETQYSNSDLGIKARSLSVEDIEKQFTETGKIAKNKHNIRIYKNIWKRI